MINVCKSEPTSVTPFSEPTREWVLRALIVTYVRYFDEEFADKLTWNLGLDLKVL